MTRNAPVRTGGRLRCGSANTAARVGLGSALLLGYLLLGAFQGAAAQAPAVDGVTVAGPKVVPGEFNGDLSKLPLTQTYVGEQPIYRPLLRLPPSTKRPTAEAPSLPPSAGPLAPMPSPMQDFAGLSFSDLVTGGQAGAGWPPDPNGDVGPNHVIEAVNDAVAIYSKTGTLMAAFTENSLWSGVGTTPCNGHSQGDPIALYDALADRWILSWFAFAVVVGTPTSPFFQCIAASKSNDPVAGGWWLYAVRMDPGGAGLPPVNDLNDYPKFGAWHDCLYMGSNEFTFPAGTYDGAAIASFSRSDLYSGAALTYALSYLGTSGSPFTLIPAHNVAKGANAVQPGTPEYFVSESGTTQDFEVRKFTAGANCGTGFTLGAPTIVSQDAYFGDFVNDFGNVVPQPPPATASNKLDNIDDRLMQRVQYRKIGGAESLWITHNVDPCTSPACTASTGRTAMQWAQLDVTGGTVAATPLQQQIYTPEATLNRWMGSIAADSQGNAALGYSTSNGTAPNFPSIAYSGRLATDPPNTLPQTEVQLIAGGGSQVNSCGGAPCHRWGDYSAMTVDPADDCTFWYFNEYYDNQTSGNAGNWHTRIGSFKFPSCGATTATRATVYRPVSVCRLVDTRGFPAAITIAGPLAPNSSTNVNAAGFCGIPNNGEVAGISLSFHVFNYTVNNGGYISFLQQGAPVSGTNAVFNTGAQWTAATANVSIPNGSGNFYAYVAQSQIELIIDVNGYYQALDSVDVGTQQLGINGNTCPSCDLFGLTNSGGGSALTITSPLGAALKIDSGTVRAAGAGVGTGTFAFLHQVNTIPFGSGGTICGGLPSYSIIDHPMTNNDAGAIVVVKPRDDAVSGTSVHATVAVEVYNIASGNCTPAISGNKWAIHSVNNSALPNGLQFNVIVVKP